jgi:O-antigen ligase
MENQTLKTANKPIFGISTNHSTYKKGIFFYFLCFLTVLYVVLSFYNSGAFGAGDGIKRGGILIVSNFSMAVFCLYHWRKISKIPFIYKTIVFWLLWFPFTFINLMPIELEEIIKGLMEGFFCPLFFLFSYILVFRQPLLSSSLIKFFLYLIIINSILFIFVFHNQQKNFVYSFFIQLNDVYYVLLLLPWALISKNKLIKNLLTILIFGIVLWSFKRTAILAFVFSLIIYEFMVNYCFGRKSWFKKIIYLFCLLFGLFIVFNFVEQKSGGFVSQRIHSAQMDEGSGRLDIYSSVFQRQFESNIFYWVFGHGHDGVRRERVHLLRSTSNPVSAHNDWLEVLFDYGLVGLFLYILLHLAIIYKCIKLIRNKSSLGPAIVSSYALFFIMSLTSHLILYPTYFSYLMAFWGMIFALDSRQFKILN